MSLPLLEVQSPPARAHPPVRVRVTSSWLSVRGEPTERLFLSRRSLFRLGERCGLISGALPHKRLRVPKASREQAITDGLTGVKTHRVLHGALSSHGEGTSTRAGPVLLRGF